MAMEQYSVSWTCGRSVQQYSEGGLSKAQADGYATALRVCGHTDVTVTLERPPRWTGLVLVLCALAFIAACVYGVCRYKRVAVACDADDAMLAVKVALMAPTTDAEYAEARAWAMSK